MGLSTENAHVFTAGNAGLGLEQVAAALRSLLQGIGYEEAEGADDRVFTLVAHDGWISIYDTETGSLDRLTKGLSQSLGASVAGIRVEDSDKYTAQLCRGGRSVDKISAGVLRKKGTGKPELWVDVLAPGGGESIAGALQGGSVFAEEPLRQLCRALNLPDQAALATPEEMSQQPPSGAHVLRYRSLQRKAPQGPPRLTVVNCGSAPVVVGQGLTQTFVSVANDGQTAQGLRVRCSGEALTQGLIALVELHVVTIVAMGGGIAGARTSHRFEPDGDGWLVGLPALALKARIDPRTLPQGAGMMKAVREYTRSPVTFNFEAEARRAGQAELGIHFEWIDGGGEPLAVRLPITINPAG
jgi:hypothetical protein